MIVTERCSHCLNGQLVSSYDADTSCQVASCFQCGSVARYIDIDGHIIQAGRAPDEGELLSIAHHNGRGRFR